VEGLLQVGIPWPPGGSASSVDAQKVVLFNTNTATNPSFSLLPDSDAWWTPAF